MILLEKEHYGKIIQSLRSVSINHLFARAVVEKRKAGKIYVDNAYKPETFYVIESYGMSLLFGNWKNIDFNIQFKDYALNKKQIRNSYEWMQTFPDEWNETLSDLFGDSLIKSADNTQETGVIELNTRVNFKFSHEKYKKIQKKSFENVEIRKTDAEIFKKMPGTVTPKYFWDSEDDFLKKGVGFSLFYDKQLAATSFSSCIIENILEIGVETVAEFRGKGLAEIVCYPLIDYCIENNYVPIWSCRLENIGSYKLAPKVGFEVAYQKPYYRLSK
jgi:RimJ/RimL family protein N-acetyltransferase